MNIDIVLFAGEVSSERVMHRSVAVIDVFRATSVIVTALDKGKAKQIIPVTGINQAFEMREHFAEKGVKTILGGERNAVIVEGFDKGNSPASYTEPDTEGATIIFSTTNGTRAINNASKAAGIFIAAFTNATAAAEKLVAAGRDIVLVCSGRQDVYTLEDALCAGMITEAITRINPDTTLSDLAWSTKELYNLHKDDFRAALAHCCHYNHIMGLGLQSDVEYCLKTDISTVVPVFSKEYAIVRE